MSDQPSESRSDVKPPSQSAKTTPDVFERLTAALNNAGIPFEHMHHEAVYTSSEAARVRNTPIHSGAKALIVKGGKIFLMVVLPADMALDGRAVQKHLKVKRLRFARKEEVLSITGLTPGSIPPFGSLFGLETVCDERLAENVDINFNAGLHTDSLKIKYVDYITYEKPDFGLVAKWPEESTEQ